MSDSIAAFLFFHDALALQRRRSKALTDSPTAPANRLGRGRPFLRSYQLPDPPLVINGDVPGGKRLGRAEDFQQQPGFGVLILSPRAGGVGLTITGANHVLHLGRWWNPAIEDQATDRVYRIGQDKPVHVYTPLAVR